MERKQLNCDFNAKAICSPNFQKIYKEQDRCQTSCPKVRFTYAVPPSSHGEATANQIRSDQVAAWSRGRAGNSRIR